MIFFKQNGIPNVSAYLSWKLLELHSYYYYYFQQYTANTLKSPIIPINLSSCGVDSSPIPALLSHLLPSSARRRTSMWIELPLESIFWIFNILPRSFWWGCHGCNEQTKGVQCKLLDLRTLKRKTHPIHIENANNTSQTCNKYANQQEQHKLTRFHTHRNSADHQKIYQKGWSPRGGGVSF